MERRDTSTKIQAFLAIKYPELETIILMIRFKNYVKAKGIGNTGRLNTASGIKCCKREKQRYLLLEHIRHCISPTILFLYWKRSLRERK
jgi:hypothetical protein